jgi:hypothetical protein
MFSLSDVKLVWEMADNGMVASAHGAGTRATHQGARAGNRLRVSSKALHPQNSSRQHSLVGITL